jgi:Resolvase, N terminal domain
LPRDGGLHDLLRHASNGRTFDAVIVKSIDRLSRMTADATRIERELEQSLPPMTRGTASFGGDADAGTRFGRKKDPTLRQAVGKSPWRGQELNVRLAQGAVCFYRRRFLDLRAPLNGSISTAHRSICTPP